MFDSRGRERPADDAEHPEQDGARKKQCVYAFDRVTEEPDQAGALVHRLAIRDWCGAVDSGAVTCRFGAESQG